MIMEVNIFWFLRTQYFNYLYKRKKIKNFYKEKKITKNSECSSADLYPIMDTIIPNIFSQIR